jgi:orotidine-5'-phosphate decarboxylase
MKQIIVALDNMRLEQSLALANSLWIDGIKEHVWGFKLNHTMIKHVWQFKMFGKVFVDLKLHDIPTTTSAVLKFLKDINVDMTTIHLSMGLRNLELIKPSTKGIEVLGVGVLTSMDVLDTLDVFDKSEREIQNRMFEIAIKSNEILGGVVMSPQDLDLFNEYDPEHKMKRICPGIRANGIVDDQKRVGTPEMAFDGGADLLVIGRPITRSANPVAAVQELLNV